MRACNMNGGEKKKKLLAIMTESRVHSAAMKGGSQARRRPLSNPQKLLQPAKSTTIVPDRVCAEARPRPC